jgi:integrase
MHSLVDFAMWAGILEIARNPISLVANKGATKRVRKARSLTAEQFSALLSELYEPFATMALLCVSLGLRISEALAIRWSDVDWLGSRLSIKRGIVEQRVDVWMTAKRRVQLRRLYLLRVCLRVSKRGSKRVNSAMQRIGYLPVRTASADCIPTGAHGMSLRGLRRLQGLGP